MKKKINMFLEQIWDVLRYFLSILSDKKKYEKKRFLKMCSKKILFFRTNLWYFKIFLFLEYYE